MNTLPPLARAEALKIFQDLSHSGTGLIVAVSSVKSHFNLDVNSKNKNPQNGLLDHIMSGC